MLLKEMANKFQGSVKTFDKKRVFYTRTDEIEKYLSSVDYEKIKNWSTLVIYPSPNNTPNKCFYFNWGWGGNPDTVHEITIAKNKVYRCTTLSGDLSDIDFDGVLLDHVTFADDVIFPKDVDFFNKIGCSGSCSVTFPFIDASKYDMRNARFLAYSFTPDSILPKERNLFKHCLKEFPNKTFLPKLNMNDYNFNGVTLNNICFTDDTIFSSKIDFFTSLKNRSIQGCTMPLHDYSKYNFKEVDIEVSKFPYDCKLPENEMFFVELSKSSIFDVKLPYLDLSKYSFMDVKITSARFSKDSALPKDKYWLTKIKRRQSYGVTFPEGDYSEYEFKDVAIEFAKFTRNSLLPENLLEQLSITYNLRGVRWPEQFIQNVLLGNQHIPIIDLCESDLSKNILKILHAKYKNSENVILPPIPFGK